MKSYKKLVPIVLIVVFALSVYQKINGNVTKIQEYKQDLKLAREYTEKGIWTDAETYYREAINLKPSIDVYLEWADMYLHADEDGSAISIANTVMEEYPKEPGGYEFLLSYYVNNEDYDNAFDVYYDIQDRGLMTDEIESIVDPIRYAYELSDYYFLVGTFSEDYCTVMDDDALKVINAHGDTVISGDYTYISAFSGGYAGVMTSDGEAYYIDTAGDKKKVIENVTGITALKMPVDEYLAVRIDEDWYFCTEDGTILFGPYDDISSFGNGYAAVCEDGKWSLIDTDGKNVLPDTYDEIVMDGKDVAARLDRVFVKQGGSYYMYDTAGKQVTDQAFEDVDMIGTDGLAAVKIDGKWGFVNDSGEMVIDPTYSEAKSFYNGYAAVKVSGKWGFVNTKGELVVDSIFDGAEYFTDEGTAFVMEGDVYKLLQFYSEK